MQNLISVKETANLNIIHEINLSRTNEIEDKP